MSKSKLSPREYEDVHFTKNSKKNKKKRVKLDPVNYDCGSDLCKNGCISLINSGIPCSDAMDENL